MSRFSVNRSLVERGAVALLVVTAKETKWRVACTNDQARIPQDTSTCISVVLVSGRYCMCVCVRLGTVKSAKRMQFIGLLDYCFGQNCHVSDLRSKHHNNNNEGLPISSEYKF